MEAFGWPQYLVEPQDMVVIRRRKGNGL